MLAKNEATLCIKILAEIGEKLGKGIAMLINIINPESFILEGTLSETGDTLRLPIRSVVNKYSLSLVNIHTQLKLPKLGEKAGIMGACLIACCKYWQCSKVKTKHVMIAFPFALYRYNIKKAKSV